MKGIFTIYVLPAVFLLLIGLIGYGIIGQLENVQERTTQTDALEAELANITKENKHLEIAIGAAGSEDMIDKEARERLNLKKEGEEVVIILPDEEAEKIDDDALLDLLKDEEEEAEKEEVDERFIDKLRDWLQGL